MKKSEAIEMKKILESDGDLTAKVVRILPDHIDLVADDDNGWDLEVTIGEEDPFTPNWDALKRVVR